jgi:hypothetical protein
VRRDEGWKAGDGHFEISATVMFSDLNTCADKSYIYHYPNFRKCILQVSTFLSLPFSTPSHLPHLPLPRFQMMNKLVRVTERPQEPRYGDNTSTSCTSD